MLVFVEEGKLENPEKNPRSKARTKNKLNPHMTLGRNLACEQAPSEVRKIFGERSEWESERRDSASEASGTLGRDSRIFCRSRWEPVRRLYTIYLQQRRKSTSPLSFRENKGIVLHAFTRKTKVSSYKRLTYN